MRTRSIQPSSTALILNVFFTGALIAPAVGAALQVSAHSAGAHAGAQRDRPTTVWIVDATGAGQFTEIQPAIDAARDGDVVLIRSGDYLPFTLDGKGLNLVEDRNADARLTERSFIRNIAAGQRAVVIGLSIDLSSNIFVPIYGLPALEVQDCAGSVRIESCFLKGQDKDSVQHPGGDGIRALSASDLSISRSELRGGFGSTLDPQDHGGNGAFAYNSNVAMFGTLSEGGFGVNSDHVQGAGRGGNGFEQLNGHLFASVSTLQGGAGGTNWVCKGGWGGAGGAGLKASTLPPIAPAPTIAHVLGATLLGGMGGDHVCLFPGSDGFPVSASTAVVQFISENPRRMECATPVRDDSTQQFIFRGVPLDHVFLVISPVAMHTWNPALNGVQLVAPPFFQQLELGSVPASGVLTIELAIPDSWAPHGSASTFEVQAVFQSTSNSVFLSNSSSLIVLDHTL